MNRLRRTSEADATLPAAPLRVGVGMLNGGGYVRSVYAAEPPLSAGLRVWRCRVAIVSISSWIFAAPVDTISSIAGYEFCY
jgi:hypothetical protein